MSRTRYRRRFAVENSKEGVAMSETVDHRDFRPVSGGLHHTDNCPVCGEAMAENKRDGVIRLECIRREHVTTIILQPKADGRAW